MAIGMVTGMVVIDAAATGAVTGPVTGHAGPGGPAAWCLGAGLALLLWPDGRQRAVVTLGAPGAARSGQRGLGWRPARGDAGGVRLFSAVGAVATPSTALVGAAGVALVAVLVAVLAALSVPLSWSLVAVLAATTATRLVRRHRVDACVAADLREATGALRALVRELLAGATPSEAARRVADDAPGRVAAILEPLAGMGFEASGGASTGRETMGPETMGRETMGPDAISGRHFGRRGPPGIGDVAARLWAAWAVAQRVGVPLADVLSALAADLAARSDARQARAAQVAGPAVSGYVLALLPLAGLLLGAGMGSDPLAVLGSGVAGGALLVTGVALCCGGLIWADRIVRGGPDG